MADFVHLTSERNARRIARAGIAARSRGWSGERGFYCSPLLPSFEATYQGVRELRRGDPAPAGSASRPGRFGVSRVRRRFPLDPPRPTKPQLMAELRAVVTSDEIVGALLALGSRSRDGAEELAYLADHPDPEVREVLADILESYRGRTARALREWLGTDSAS